MHPTWVVQSNKIKTSQTLQLVQALTELGEPFVDVAVDTEEGLMNELPSGDNFIPYGSVELVRLAQERGWRHTFFNEKFRMDTYVDNHPQMLNGDGTFFTMSEAKWMLQTCKADSKWFLRPVHDLKSFPGTVDTAQGLVDWITRLESGEYDIDGTCLVLLSNTKDIQMEWRYLVVDRKIVTGSSYRFRGYPHRARELDKEVLEEAQDLADIWLPHPCCCMDIALYRDRPYVVEFNGLNASGFYDHDVKAFAAAVSSYASTGCPAE